MNYKFYSWEILLYAVFYFLIIYISKHLFKNRKVSRESKRLFKLINSSPKEISIKIKGTNDEFYFRFEATVVEEEIVVTKLIPYCLNCRDEKIRMTETSYGQYECDCGKDFDFDFYEKVKSMIISKIENSQINY